jgi:hypothetical protein
MRNWGLGYFTRAQHECGYLLAKAIRPNRKARSAMSLNSTTYRRSFTQTRSRLGQFRNFSIVIPRKTPSFSTRSAAAAQRLLPPAIPEGVQSESKLKSASVRSQPCGFRNRFLISPIQRSRFRSRALLDSERCRATNYSTLYGIRQMTIPLNLK